MTIPKTHHPFLHFEINPVVTPRTEVTFISGLFANQYPFAQDYKATSA
jgi:hypothetical protein